MFTRMRAIMCVVLFKPQARSVVLSSLGMSSCNVCPNFDGNFDALPRESPFGGVNVPSRYPFGSAFVPPQFLTLGDGRKLYLAVVDPSVEGGTKRGNTVFRERLCVAFLPEDEPDVYLASRYHRRAVCPARFFWLREDFSLKAAPACRRADGQESLRMNAYSAEGRRVYLTVHSVLGLTFRCPPQLWSRRFTDDCEVDHTDQNHGNNLVTNLLAWHAQGAGGHRAQSGSLGGRATKLRRLR